MVQVGGTNSYYSYTPTQTTQYAAVAGAAPSNPYQGDAYSGGSYYAPASMAASGTITSIVSDPKAASRFSLFMINSPSRLLTVGAKFGVVGRAFLNMLAGNVPLFTSAAQSNEISNNVRTWISSADLVRTGANPTHAMLLQDVGIWNVQDLTVYVNPADQSVLAGRLAGAAAARGVMDVPNPQMVSSWVQTANQLPLYSY